MEANNGNYRMNSEDPMKYDVFSCRTDKEVYSSILFNLLGDYMYDLTSAAFCDDRQGLISAIVEKDIEYYNQDLNDNYNAKMILEKAQLRLLAGSTDHTALIERSEINNQIFKLGEIDAAGIIKIWLLRIGLYKQLGRNAEILHSRMQVLLDIRNKWSGHAKVEPGEEWFETCRTYKNQMLSFITEMPESIEKAKNETRSARRRGLLCHAGNTERSKNLIEKVCRYYAGILEKESAKAEKRIYGVNIDGIDEGRIEPSDLCKQFIIADETALTDSYNALLFDWILPFQKIHVFKSSVISVGKQGSSKENPDSKLVKEALKRMELLMSQKGQFEIMDDSEEDGESFNSIIEYIKSNAWKNIFVITQNNYLADAINSLGIASAHSAWIESRRNLRLSKFGKAQWHQNEPVTAVSENRKDPAPIEGSGIIEEPEIIEADTKRYIPTKNDKVRIVVNGKKQEIILKEEIGKGGEGNIYSNDTLGNYAVKIFENPDEKRLRKIREMVKQYDRNIIPDNITWPEYMIYDPFGDCEVGYAMKKVEDAVSVDHIVSGVLSDSDEFDEWKSKTILCDACIAIAETFSKLHNIPGVLMGDVNPGNILLSKSNDRVYAYFIDVDSFQYSGMNCPVGMIEYTSPRILKEMRKGDTTFADICRNKEDEIFAETTLFFYILTVGEFPFDNKGESLEDCILNGRFKYANESNATARRNFTWRNIHPNIRVMFSNTFRSSNTYDDASWIRSFYEMKDGISAGRLSDETFPNSALLDENDSFIEIKCRLCGKEIHVSRKQYENNSIREETDVCPKCKNARAVARSIIYKLDCPCCGVRFTINHYDAAGKDLDDLRCPSCTNGESFPMSKLSQVKNSEDRINTDNLKELVRYAVRNMDNARRI